MEKSLLIFITLVWIIQQCSADVWKCWERYIESDVVLRSGDTITLSVIISDNHMSSSACTDEITFSKRSVWWCRGHAFSALTLHTKHFKQRVRRLMWVEETPVGFPAVNGSLAPQLASYCGQTSKHDLHGFLYIYVPVINSNCSVGVRVSAA